MAEKPGKTKATKSSHGRAQSQQRPFTGPEKLGWGAGGKEK